MPDVSEGEVRAARRMRSSGLLAGFVLSIALTGWALQRVSVALVPIPPETPLSIVPSIDYALGRSPARNAPRVIFLGDSTAWRRSQPVGVAPALGEILHAEGIPVQVVPLVYPGFTIFDYGFIADRVAGSAPEVVVLAINMTGFRDPALVGGTARRELSGWVAPGRLATMAQLPLASVGLTLDHLLLYVGLVRSGLVEPWRLLRREQARIGAAWTTTNERAPEARLRATSLQRIRERRTAADRYTAAGFRRAYGDALDGIDAEHPSLALLRSALGPLVAAGATPVAYAVPMDHEMLARAGIDPGGLQKSVQTIEASVVASGGVFVDLHALLPTAAFTGPTHFDTPPPEQGLRRVAEALTPSLRDVFYARARARSLRSGAP